ncbi:hypothetical protein [Luteimonas vadosa]|uniref:Uncharacterized protein n=1 Tax=Luteimonas vadosa TaxID=1165507 RepID=A0ABP9DSH7_9GAMM
MNATDTERRNTEIRDATTPSPTDAGEMASRPAHRERDYGIGYGSSSGYGSERHFTDGHADPLFHLG